MNGSSSRIGDATGVGACPLGRGGCRECEGAVSERSRGDMAVGCCSAIAIGLESDRSRKSLPLASASWTEAYGSRDGGMERDAVLARPGIGAIVEGRCFC